MNKIKKLIEAGEKATQGKWWTSPTGIDVETDIFTFGLGMHNDNQSFIVSAANARAEIKSLYEAAEAMAKALKEMASYANESKLRNTQDFLEGLFERVQISSEALERYNKLRGKNNAR